jgi:hypothetical protein
MEIIGYKAFKSPGGGIIPGSGRKNGKSSARDGLLFYSFLGLSLAPNPGSSIENAYTYI